MADNQWVLNLGVPEADLLKSEQELDEGPGGNTTQEQLQSDSLTEELN